MTYGIIPTLYDDICLLSPLVMVATDIQATLPPITNASLPSILSTSCYPKSLFPLRINIFTMHRSKAY